MAFGAIGRTIDEFKALKLGFTEDFNKSRIAFESSFGTMIDLFRVQLLTLQGETETISASFTDKIFEIQGKLSEIKAELVLTPPISETSSPPTGTTTKATEGNFVEARFEAAPDPGWYENIYGAWNDLVGALRRALGEPDDFDGRQISEMAFRLVDRRRKNSINTEAADNISNIQSRFNRYKIRKSKVKNWINEDEYSSFIKDTNDATRALRSAAITPETCEDPGHQSPPQSAPNAP